MAGAVRGAVRGAVQGAGRGGLAGIPGPAGLLSWRSPRPPTEVANSIFGVYLISWTDKNAM